jgi:hypothetical protein
MSNVYVATDGKTVMKVGKTNNVKQREKQIDLPITIKLSCPNAAVAFQIEREFRHIIVEMGGVRHVDKVDWFDFDSEIYLALLAFATSLEGFKPTLYDGIPDAEIPLRRKQFVQGIKDERKTTIKELSHENQRLRQKITFLEEEREELREELKTLQENYERLLLKFGRLEGTIHVMKMEAQEWNKALNRAWNTDV